MCEQQPGQQSAEPAALLAQDAVEHEGHGYADGEHQQAHLEHGVGPEQGSHRLVDRKGRHGAVRESEWRRSGRQQVGGGRLVLALVRVEGDAVERGCPDDQAGEDEQQETEQIPASRAQRIASLASARRARATATGGPSGFIAR